MAVYMSATRQRRRTILVAVAAVVVGVLVGFMIGRSSAPGVSDAVGDARTRGQNLASALRALPFEYEQALTGAAGESTAGIDDAIRRVSDRSTQAIADTPWLTTEQKDAIASAIGDVTSAAQERVAPGDFGRLVEGAAVVVERTFGVT